MRMVLTTGLLLTLGLQTIATYAEESPWRPVPEPLPAALQSAPALPAVALGAPVALPAPASNVRRTAGAYPPAVTLAKPIAIAGDRTQRPTPPVILAAFCPADAGSARPIIRAQNAEDTGALPAPRALPSGPPNPEMPATDPSASPPPSIPADGEHTDCLDCPPCADSCECCPLACCAPANRFYASADYLLWSMKGYRVPPLVTTSTSPTGLGILGQNDTVLLFGDKDLGTDARSGARFRAGYWFDECQNWGIEGSFFFLSQNGTRFSANSADIASGVLARPIIVQNPISVGPFSFPGEFVELVAVPNGAQGSIVVASTSRLWGADLNLRKNLCGDCCWRVDLLWGFRYLDLFDNLFIQEQSTNLVTGQVASAFDSFTTRNQFYGGQVGMLAEWRWRRLILDLRGTVALGDTHELININGASEFRNPTENVQGNLLAQPTNIGRHEHDQFSVVPEIGLNLGYQITDHIRAHVGYSFLYWSNVVRPGDQIDRTIDARQLHGFMTTTPPTGTPGPVVPFKTTDFWAQGVNVGLEFIW